jgi:hypothetical protein
VLAGQFKHAFEQALRLDAHLVRYCGQRQLASVPALLELHVRLEEDPQLDAAAVGAEGLRPSLGLPVRM